MTRVEELKEKIVTRKHLYKDVIAANDVHTLGALLEAQIARKDAALWAALPILQDYAPDAEGGELYRVIEQIRAALTQGETE